MPAIPGLRSPYARVGRLVYFGRMLDKIRLHAEGRLPADYLANLGEEKPTVFDGRCCRFLRVSYAALRERTLAGGADTEILAWAETQSPAGPRTDEECEIFNAFLSKRGWRDLANPLLRQRIAESALEDRPIQTMFDYLDFDEGRDPVATRAWELKPTVIVVMGVAGSGKTTVGETLARSLGWQFTDADTFHPAANLAKMAAGDPLDDTDRAPWLATLRAHIATRLQTDTPLVLACSALKQRYRDTLFVERQRMRLLYLKGARELLHQRLAARSDHFMKPGMLDSQLAALEEPADALTVSIELSTDAIVSTVRDALGL